MPSTMATYVSACSPRAAHALRSDQQSLTRDIKKKMKLKRVYDAVLNDVSEFEYTSAELGKKPGIFCK